jgi:D-3-phosphoglycerate dehydrogenase
MLMAARSIGLAWDYARHLQGSDAEITEQVEAGKKRFVGVELPNRTLGVIGLGAIGVKVANAAQALGMRVIGYDPHITVSNAWQLSAQVEQVMSVDDVLAQAHFVSLHVPLSESTRHLIHAKCLMNARQGITILNFARQSIVDEEAVCEAIRDGKVNAYVCDFPSNYLKDHERVVTLPHLGASTQEAEENCAIMVADQVREYLENGTVRNSVNFPEMFIPRNGGCRMLVVNANIPHMIERISTAIANADINIMDLLNRSRGEIACTMVDVECTVPESVVAEIGGTEGVLAVRVL